MPKTVDNYIIQKQLFKDHFQIEYLSCQHKVLKKPFTLKKVEKAADVCNSKQEEKHQIQLSFVYSCIENEIQISRQLKSEKVIKCLKILKAKNSVYAVYDQHPERTLEKILASEYLTTQKRQTLLNEILQLVRELHQLNIALGNLQPSNIFFTQDYKLLISNFLISRKVEDFEESNIDKFLLDPSCIYYAPQLLKSGTLSKASDIYSLGQIIKALKFQKSDQDFLSPVKYSTENLKDLVERMLDQNPQNRPTIGEFQKHFRLNKSRNKSTCGSNGSRDNQQKMADVRGLQSYKSEATFKFFGQKIDSSFLQNQESKKTLLSKRQTINQDMLDSKPRKIALKSRMTMDSNYHLQSSKLMTLQVPSIRKSRGGQSSRSGKSIASSTKIEQTFAIGSYKETLPQIMLLRNLVSFLIEMALFVNQQPNSKDLSFYLIQQAINYTNTLLKTLENLMQQEDWRGKSLIEKVEECQKQKKKLIEIASYFHNEGESKAYYDLHLNEELKRFGKFILSTNSSDFSIQKNISQVSETPCRSKQVIEVQKSKPKQIEEKLFKTFMILKRLEYGNYFDFFKAKVHHSNKKFWNQHYFEFEKTFGGRYFAIQIKDLIARK